MSRWPPLARWLLAALALAELAAALALQSRPTDSPTATANALAIIALTACVWTLVRNSKLETRNSQLVIAVWLVLGLLRALPLFTGRPGWLLNQSFTAGGQTVASHTLVRDVNFQAGLAPAHLVNDLAIFRSEIGDRSHAPLAIQAVSHIRGRGQLTVASSAPVTVRLGDRVLFDSSPPPGAPSGTVLTPNGPLSLEAIRRGLQQAGYNGPTDDASVAFAYIRTALSGGWRVDVDAPDGDRLSVEVAPQDISTASLQVRLSGALPFAAPAPGGFGQLMARLSLPLDVASLVLAVGAGLWLAWRFVLARSGSCRRQLALGASIAVLYGAARLADWASSANRLAILSGADDWFRHEALARDIGQNILLLLGAPMGQAEPYDTQVLYPYYLALGHVVAGESVQGLVLIQLLAVMVVVVVALLTLPEAAALTIGFLLVAASGIVAEWFNLATYLLSENLLLLLFGLLLLAISRLGTQPSPSQLWLVGALLGLAILARATTWLAVPFLLAVVCFSPGVGRSVVGRRVAAVGLSMLLVAAVIPVRNIIAAHTAIPIPISAPVNMSAGLIPSDHVITSEPWLSLSQKYNQHVVAIAEAVVNAPDRVLGQLLRNAAYVLGFPRSRGRVDVPVVFWPVFLLWAMAPLALLSGRPSRLALAAIVLAMMHAFALIIIIPDTYYYRLLMPATLPLAIWDAIALGQILQGLPDPSWLGCQLQRAWKAGGVRGLHPTP